MPFSIGGASASSQGIGDNSGSDPVFTSGKTCDGNDSPSGDVAASDEYGEAAPKRCKSRPVKPTKEEVTAHEVSHYPYRSWCPHCVAAMGRRDKHASVSAGNVDEMVPTVAVDYFFFNDVSGTDAEHDPILLVKDRRSKTVFADVVLEKGGHWYSVKCLVDHILWLGHSRVKLRSDGERPIRSLLDKAAAELKAKGVDVVPDQTAKGDSISAGLHEAAVHVVKGKCRAIWRQAAQLHGIKNGMLSTLLPWCVLYAAQLITRTHRHDNGQTSWTINTGSREYRRPLVPWLEKVLYLEGGGKFKAGVEPKFKEGVFLALTDVTDEYIIGTAKGCVKSNNVKRVPEEDARDLEMVKAIRGQPWKLSPTMEAGTRTQDLPVRISMAPVVQDQALPQSVGRGADAGPRRLYIRRDVELENYGKTEGCKGCLACDLGHKAVAHTEECRRRIEAAMTQNAEKPEDQARVRAVRRKLDEDHKVEEDAKCGSTLSAGATATGTVPASGATELERPAAAGATALQAGRASAGATAMPGELSTDTEMTPTEMSAGAPATDPGYAERPAKSQRVVDRVDKDSSMEEMFALFEISTSEDDSTLDSDVLALGDPNDPNFDLLTLGDPNPNPRADVAEIFSPDRVTARAAQFGLVPGLALDLRTGWDLNDSRHVAALWRYLKAAKPQLVVGSPECAPFSRLQTLNRNNPTYGATLREGLQHLKLVCEVYRWQHDHGRLFVHEHPYYATSWNLDMVKRLRSLKGVMVAYTDQCMFGQTVRRGSEEGLAKKPTGFMTNSEAIYNALSKVCDKSHEHMELIGGIARQAAAYPVKLVDAILRGLATELRKNGRLESMDGGGPTIDEPAPEEPWIGQYWDEISGAELDPKLVRQARLAEIEYMHKLKVYEEASEAECRADGCVPIPMRWIDVNKGDEAAPIIRSRAVLQETKARSNIAADDIAATFAATPPLEGLRVLISLAQTGQLGKKLADRRVLGFYDVSRAHWHSPTKRKMYVRTLPEDTQVATGIARQLKAMYGGRDAGACWDEFSGKVMQALDFTPGVFSTCVYHSKSRDAQCWRHGDDFVVLATRAEHKKFLEDANKHMLLKAMGVLGPMGAEGDVSEIRCMNRILRYVQPPYGTHDQGYIEWESDPRHLEILMSSLKIEGSSKSLGQPSAKQEKTADLTPLSASRKAEYRSNTMRLAYVAQDRPDIQYASKELARHMNDPTQWDESQLKRAVRYLKGCGRLVQQFKQQAVPRQVVVCTDSDFAGCVRTRKSTSCCMVFYGLHLWRSTSTTQAVISLSSGEAEFYSAVKGASVGIGITSLLRDFGVTMPEPIRLRVDSTACLGMAGRKGAGRVRHIHTPCLWIQHAVADGRVVIDKIGGTANPADLGTKSLAKEPIRRILAQCGFATLQGRSAIALKAAGHQ